MTPLFKCKGHPRGTENPIHAIECLKSRGEQQLDMPYVIIWRLFDFSSEEPPKDLLENKDENGYDWNLYHQLERMQKGVQSITQTLVRIKQLNDRFEKLREELAKQKSKRFLSSTTESEQSRLERGE